MPEGTTADAACLPVVDRSAEFPELTIPEGSVGHPDVIIPNPGRIEAGTTYKNGRLPVANSATYRTYLEVYPQPAGTMQPNSFALATATNRVDAGVEVLAYYTTGPNGPDVPLLRVFDWSCLPAYPCANGATSPAYTWTVQIRDVTCYYKMLEDNTGHYVNYVYYRNSSWLIDPGVPPSTPPLWRNAVTFLNFCTSQYDGVYEHDYRLNQQDCSVTGCKSWAGIVEVDDRLPPAENIAKQGFHHQALDYDGQTSLLTPDDANFIYPPPQWQLYYLVPNRLYETGTYQDDDGDGVPNTTDVDDDGDGSADLVETPCGADPISPYRRPERIDGVYFQVDDDGDGPVNEALPAGSETYDCDGDGFTGVIETFVFSATGTEDDQTPCAWTPAPNDEAWDRWPTDNNDDQRTNLADILKYIPVFNSSAPGPPYNRRYDLTASNSITLGDVLVFIPYFNKVCAP